jgi:hypothetical protein
VIKRRKMATLNEYIMRIEDQDTTLTSITLDRTGLNNADAERLMQALRNAPEIAKSITSIDLNSNQLTSINIPATLIALQGLHLSSNQLTSINIPATLIALQELDLQGNQLTAATKLALSALRAITHGLRIVMDANAPEQLTSEILQDHFETMRPVFLASAQSREFKNALINATFIKSKSVKSRCKGARPIDLISMVLNVIVISFSAELDKNITMFKNAFANDEQQLNILHEWIDTLYVGYKQDISNAQSAVVEILLNELKSNIQNFFIGSQDSLLKKYFEGRESDDIGSGLLYNIEKTHFVNSNISDILSIQEQYPELAPERNIQHLMFGHPDFAKGDPLVKMVENVKNGEPGLNFNFLTPIAKRALAWQNALSYGLIVTDSTSVDPTQNPFQLALRSRI